MRIRFVSTRPDPNINAELGMFAARDFSDFSQQKGSIQRAPDKAFYWFSADGRGGLTYPRLKGKVRIPEIRKSLFWFREDAKVFHREAGSVIVRARELAFVLTVAGCEIRELRTKNPGKVIWEDGCQVLALPILENVPRAF